MLSDLDFVTSVEQDPANRPFITPWERTQHEGAIRFPDFRHFIVEAGPGYASAGFVILQGCRNPHRSVELKRIADMAALAAKNGIEPHAGHGLTYENVTPIAAIPQLAELNIGHYLIGEAIFCGLEASIRRMRELMDLAR